LFEGALRAAAMSAVVTLQSIRSTLTGVVLDLWAKADIHAVPKNIQAANGRRRPRFRMASKNCYLCTAKLVGLSCAVPKL
jgi:hypothetical protein